MLRLYPEVTMRSGAAIRCEALAPHVPEGSCCFVAYALLSDDRELPRTDVTGGSEP